MGSARSHDSPARLHLPSGRFRHSGTMLGAFLGCVLAVALVCPATVLAQQIRLHAVARATSAQLHDLGTVTDAAKDAEGRVYILDPTAHRIIVTDAHLRRLGSFGRRGAGPGEFREPVSVGVLSNGRIAVLDRALGRITVLAVRDGGRSLVMQQTINLNINSEAMCVLPGDEFLIYGFESGGRLHVFDRNGRRRRSFAPPAARLSPMAQGLLARGKIACDAERDEVLVASRFSPWVELFRVSTGAQIWTERLQPFRETRVQDRGSQVTISSGASGLSLISGLLNTRDYLLFQTVYDSRTDGATADTVMTYVYSRQARRWLPRADGAPLVFGLGGGSALSVHGRDRLQMLITLDRVLTAANAPGPARRPD
jgi:hypothetical protein